MGRSEFCFPSSSPRPGSQAVLPNQPNFWLYSPHYGPWTESTQNDFTLIESLSKRSHFSLNQCGLCISLVNAEMISPESEAAWK
jgi:hypothetical protein